jgi:basic amino acid/polyamine antiporter, APA family
VRDPAHVIPRAIVLALAGAIVVYAVVAVAVLSVLGASGTAASTAPLAEAVDATSGSWAVTVVRVGAGLGRTGLAMAREHDLPRWFDAVHPRYRVPHRAELSVAAIVVALVLTTDLRGAIGFSSFGVLLYYFVANASAYRQGPTNRRFPRWLQVLGMAGCLVLVAALPWRSVVAGVAVLAVGMLLRAADAYRRLRD